jgi:hypothetical protein
MAPAPTFRGYDPGPVLMSLRDGGPGTAPGSRAARNREVRIEVLDGAVPGSEHEVADELEFPEAGRQRFVRREGKAFLIACSFLPFRKIWNQSRTRGARLLSSFTVHSEHGAGLSSFVAIRSARSPGPRKPPNSYRTLPDAPGNHGLSLSTFAQRIDREQSRGHSNIV